ncbi:MAG: hypothetical protein IPM54_17320 [Polyangiaceae bacterium]|nr:hypothetical protein [Polyangiaceae bacterium]
MGQAPGTLTAGTTFGFTGHLGTRSWGSSTCAGVYDPNLGRFLTADPFIANPLSGQNWNRYAYVANNPLKYTDPSGFTGEDPAAPPGLLDNNGNPVAAGGPLEVWVFGKKRETPEQAAELGALRDSGDLTTTGDRPAFQPDAPPNGSEEDTSDGLDIMLDVLGGASGAYANDVIDYAKGMVIFATFPPGYFMWQGYNFWGGLANGAVQGYEQDGVFGALAGAVNTLNPLALVGISLAATVDSAEKGDYAKAGEHGYQAAKVLAGIALGAIGGGIKLGGGGGRPAGPPRAGYNGVQGPVRYLNERTTRQGTPGARVEFPDKSVLDVSPKRVKEYVPNTNPNAPPGTMQRVQFENAQPHSHGLKRDPTPQDLEWLR